MAYHTDSEDAAVEYRVEVGGCALEAFRQLVQYARHLSANAQMIPRRRRN